MSWQGYNVANGTTYPACGELDRDGRAELVIGLGRGGNGYLETKEDLLEGGSHLDWANIGWSGYSNAEGGGSTRPACGDLDGDGSEEVVVGLAEGGGGWLRVMAVESASLRGDRWLRVNWSGYCSGPDGETWPALGRLK